MDNWLYLETVARQKQAETRRLADRMRQVRLAEAAKGCAGRSHLASVLATIGVKLDAEAARTAVSRAAPEADARRAA